MRAVKLELPFVVGRSKIMVQINREGLLFWKKRKQEKLFIPWGKVIPWKAYPTGEDADTVGTDITFNGGDD